MPALSRRTLLAAAASCGAAAALGGCSLASGQAAPEAEAEAGAMQLIDGVPIHLRRFGRGRSVTLLHGASGNLNDMTFRLAPALVAAGYEVVALDRPGHGRSGLPPGGNLSIAAQAGFLRRALAGAGIGRTLLVGHSYGGSVALAWAVDAPESLDGLLLLSAPSQVWSGGLGLSTDLLASSITGPAIAAALPRLVTRGFAERTLNSVFAPQTVPPGYLDHLDLGLVLQSGSLRENARQLARLKEDIRPMVPRYPGLRIPVGLLHGEADRTVGLEIHSAPLAKQLPDVWLTRLPGIGHMPHQVVTGEVVRAVARLAARS